VSHLAALAEALENERRAVTFEHAQLRSLPMPDRVAAGFSLAPLDIVTTEHRSKGRVNVILRGKNLGDAFAPGIPWCSRPSAAPTRGTPGAWRAGTSPPSSYAWTACRKARARGR